MPWLNISFQISHISSFYLVRRPCPLATDELFALTDFLPLSMRFQLKQSGTSWTREKCVLFYIILVDFDTLAFKKYQSYVCLDGGNRKLVRAI